MFSTQEPQEKSLIDGGIRTLEISSKLDYLAQVRKFVAEAAGPCGFYDDDLFDIRLATSEAVANAIEHGSPEGHENSVNITCSAKSDSFYVTIKDQGLFKKRIPIAVRGESYRGRGIPLMLALMDRVVIDEKPDGTLVTLSKNLPSEFEIAAGES